MPESITPVPRQAFTSAEFGTVEFHFNGGALESLMAFVAFGHIDTNGDFVRRRTVNLEFNKAKVMANLSTAEKAALASIKAKLMQAAINQL